MNHLRSHLLLLLFFCVLAPFLPNEANASTEERARYIILYEKSQDEFLSDIESIYIHEKYDAISAAVVSLTNEQVQALSQRSHIKSVTHDQIVEVEGQIVDWGINSTKANIAHDMGKTGNGVKVAVLDTGIDLYHPDLKVTDGTCFVIDNTGSLNCTNGYLDKNGHGTHVSGIISAINNNVGSIGVAYNAQLYAVKVLGDDGEGYSSSVLKGIEWAIDKKVDIINLSLATPQDDPAVKAMMDYAYQKGILIVAAAGNNGTSSGIGDTAEYPGKYDSVISVAALTQLNGRATFSATGPSIELIAPGELIYSTLPTSVSSSGYGKMSGTSMAAPYVSGLLALYKEQYPYKTNAELRQLLISEAIDLGEAGRDSKFGFGLVQADLEQVKASTQMDMSVITNKGSATFTISSFPDGVSSYDVYRDGLLIKKGATSSTWIDYLVKGTYHYEFVTTNGITKFDVVINEPYFQDLSMKDDWFADELVFLNNNGIIFGFEGNLIKPRQYITRGEAIVMLGRAIGLDGTKRETVFSDVHPDTFASGYIQSAYDKGILKGYPDKTFRASQYVTRGEMAILLAKAYELMPSSTFYFSDVQSHVTGYQSINSLALANITLGFPDRTFKPYDKLSRAAFAVFIARAENDRFKEIK